MGGCPSLDKLAVARMLAVMNSNFMQADSDHYIRQGWIPQEPIRMHWRVKCAALLLMVSKPMDQLDFAGILNWVMDVHGVSIWKFHHNHVAF